MLSIVDVSAVLTSSLLVVTPQGSGEEEDLDEDDSLSEDSGSENQDDLQDDSEYSEKKSQPPTPSPSPPETPRPTRRRRKARSPSYSDDENRPPSPKVSHLPLSEPFLGEAFTACLVLQRELSQLGAPYFMFSKLFVNINTI